jgi:choline monooxygenase
VKAAKQFSARKKKFVNNKQCEPDFQALRCSGAFFRKSCLTFQRVMAIMCRESNPSILSGKHRMIDPKAVFPLSEELLETVPIERAETIPSSWYTDPQFHDIDRECIFARTWQNVGHIGQVRNAGDALVATVAENPVLAVRGKDGVLRAFYNVCKHRGGPLATKDCTVKVLQCQYHGWTYLLDGSLRGVPEFDRVELFDKKDYGLVPIHVDVWEGMVFVNLSENPQPLHSIFEGITERISPIELSTKKFCKRVNYEVNCNWKVYVDNYLEGYHLPYVHPELCNLLDYQNYVTETFEYYSLQYSPFTGKANLYTRGEGAAPHPITNEAVRGEAFYYFVFPNFMLNILPGRLQSNIIVPLAHDRTLTIFDYYYDDIDSPQARKMIEEDVAYSDRIQKEDIEICEHVQRGLASKAYHRGRFSVKCERGVYHFQRLLKEAYKKL